MEHYHYILTVIGISYVITESGLVEPFREAVIKFNEDLVFPFGWFVNKFEGIITCIYCCSFWIGIIVCLLIKLGITEIDILFNAFSVLGTIYIVKNIFSKY
jgi:hypothetical protein